MLSTTTRRPSTNKHGSSFDIATIAYIWSKAATIPGKDPSTFRKDKCGAEIKYLEYGNRQSIYGWEVDHILAVSKNGDDSLANLQPLHWQNNLSKSDGPNYSFCKVTF